MVTAGFCIKSADTLENTSNNLSSPKSLKAQFDFLLRGILNRFLLFEARLIVLFVCSLSAIVYVCCLLIY